jgi:hypothetical protein
MTLLSYRRKVTYCFWALVFVISLVRPAQAQIALPLTLGCVWPFETTPTTLNVMYPDSNAIYWTTPYILLPGSSLEIKGDFFATRFMSINTYNTLGASLSSNYDVNFSLDSGSDNPFTNPNVSGGSFHATIVPSPSAVPPKPPVGSDIIYGPPINKDGFSQGYVVIRSYLPNGKVSQSELPKITVALRGHSLATLSPCKTLSNSLRLLLFNALVRFWDGNFDPPGPTPPSTEFKFRPPSATQANGAFPNDFNKYVATGITYQKGVIAVVRGLGATVPKMADNGYPLLQNQSPNLRYWSLCNYDHVFPFPVVVDNGTPACAADNQTALDEMGYYTYIVAAPADIPDNAKTDKTVTILPWGRTQLDKALVFRNMLPDLNFTTTAQTANVHCADPENSVDYNAACTSMYMGPYYPKSTYCQKSLYEAGGWKACFQNPTTNNP